MIHPAPHRRPVIAIDMDEVIADALGEHLLRYNRDFPPQPSARPLSAADIHGRSLWDVIPAPHRARVAGYIISEDFFAVLDPMPHSQRVLQRLQQRYDLFIATAAMEVPTSFTAKFDWLARHFPFIPSSHIVFCGDKSILRADFLIDDNPRQLRLFEARKGQSFRDPAEKSARSSAPASAEPAREGILFTSPSNALIQGFRRIDNWLEAETLFLP